MSTQTRSNEHLDDPLVRVVLASSDPFTLDLPPEFDCDEAKARLAQVGSNDAWRAYDLVHQLAIFGRAF